MVAIYRYLNSNQYVLMQSTLKLLVAIANHSMSTTQELVQNFNFNLKALPSLLLIRKKHKTEPTVTQSIGDKVRRETNLDRNSIRGLYIQFLMALIQRGDTAVRSSLLQIKKLINLIFKDLKNDSFHVRIVPISKDADIY